MDYLIQGCEALGIPLSPQQVEQFQQYYELLVEWNQRMNLTAITELHDVQTKHFLDCLAGLPLIAEELGEGVPPARAVRAIDVGAGAGFPGLPLKIAWPALELTLLDGTGKKVRFLRTVVEHLDLEKVTVVQGRAEEVGRQPTFREQFDLVMARAVAPLNTLVEYLLPLCCLNGYAMAFKGPHAGDEFMAARKAIEVLGGETVRFAPVQVPFLEEERRILLIQKKRRTPRAYPRQQGLPRKQPIGAH
ncbi:MAG: 16S rRNA (guanine(527)-N(7))-methyltransferase RsmG [Caldilineae bacterium]|nr:MAG: 16S rRNA (guanine(527)-N(7))-methyltransferase RsmG [Caldilineae bacterium]